MKKVLSILLAIIMLFTMIPAAVFAAEGTTVKLVSFMRGDVNDLRSSELLEVQVEGYDGNPRELTYKWTSSLGTYLYIYNSHNMYGINDTYGEYEIYNTSKNISRSSNVEENRAGNKTLTLVGFMWASVYGAYAYSNTSAKDALAGTVTVEVFDKNGKSLGSDSFSSFKAFNLANDIDNVVIGIFEGDRVNVLDLLGQSGIVHITCEQSKVSSATIVSGGDHIAIESEKKGNNNYNYFIKGLKAGDSNSNGDAEISIEIKKATCKFHYNSSGKASPIVYVFKKPKTSTTTTTLTLVDDLDNRCEYFINGNKGEKQDDGTIIFTGLDPNTTYTVEVRAKYNDNGKTKYVYGYVEDTTKPVYKATVYTLLDNVKTDISVIHGEDVTLYLREDKENAEYIDLIEEATGTYSATVTNGVYYPWHIEDGDHYHQAREYMLIVENANAELYLRHYSVTYDTTEGAFADGTTSLKEIYSSGAAVNATESVPVRDGYAFAGWEIRGKVVSSGAEVTSSITSPLTLKAKWEKDVNVTINVTIDHKTADGFDPNPTRADLDVNFLEMTANSPAFVETGDKLHFRQNAVTDENGNKKAYTYTVENNKSTYTATDYTYTGLLESSTFGVALSKSGYDVGIIEKKQDKLGNWVINIPLTYNPDDFDLDFSIEMADDVPTELYPDAVIVKVAYWNTETNEWKIISQQETTGAVVKPGVRVDIDEVTGEGSGSYPVWRFDGKNNPYGYRAVVTGFIYGNSVITVPEESINGKIVTYTDGNYTATMGIVADGNNYGSALNGAYYNENTNAQTGTLDGVITVEKYDVIFDANGGKINGGNTYTEKDEYYVPNTKVYVPEFDGHEFKGWYKDPEFKEPVTDGEILKENVTFYAKWDQILTGNVRVAGSYMQDGVLVNIHSIDRAVSAEIILQEITDEGIYNIDRQLVNIVWPMSEMVYGISEEYRFTNLDPSKSYRTEVIVNNYGTTYQNSTTVFVNDDNFADDYNSKDYRAVYPADSKWETFVNAYLSFEPASYFQPVEVDATLIGASLRPENTLVQVWYKATGTDNAYQVISQHTVVPYGIEVGMGADGMDDGYYGYLVWNNSYNGSLYDYQAYLDKIDGQAVSEWPVSVVYGSPSRYSPLHNAATGVLQVKLVPNRYSITYNENYVNEDVTVVSNGVHVWSYETPITYVPVREGYIFEGWYDNAECTGKKVTAIAETVAQDTDLYAKWVAETGKELTVNYVDKNTGALLDSVINEYSFDDVVTAESLKKDFTGYTYDSASAESVKITHDKNEITLYYVRNNYNYIVNYLEEGTNKVLADKKTVATPYGEAVTEYVIAIDGYTPVNEHSKTITITTNEENNVINFYYAADTFGGGEDGDEGDGTPDKYQKKVIFKVVNGMWSNGTTKDIVQILTLVKDGKFSVDGTAVLIAPTGMIASKDYVKGTWDVTPPAEVSGTNTEVYTYSFDRGTTPIVPGDKVAYIVEHYIKRENWGEWSGADKTEFFTGTIGNTVEGVPLTVEGFAYNPDISYAKATLKAIANDSDIVVLKLYYEKDVKGGENGGDGIPDDYQREVIFEVKNGSWNDGTSNKKYAYITLRDANGKLSANGSATVTLPDVGNLPAEGYKEGKWLNKTFTVKLTGTNVFTYEYAPDVPEAPVDPDTPDNPGNPGNPDNPGSGDIGGEGGSGSGSGSGSGEITGKHYIIFGKTDGIGWYNVSQDGGQTYDIVFGNSHYEVEEGTEIIIKASDIMGDSFTFYVNGDAVTPDENNEIRLTVKGYMLIGAIGIDPDLDFEVPDAEESLNWFQRLIKAIKDFFAKLFGKN